MSTKLTENKRVVRRIYEKLWNQAKLTVAGFYNNRRSISDRIGLVRTFFTRAQNYGIISVSVGANYVRSGQRKR